MKIPYNVIAYLIVLIGLMVFFIIYGDNHSWSYSSGILVGMLTYNIADGVHRFLSQRMIFDDLKQETDKKLTDIGIKTK